MRAPPVISVVACFNPTLVRLRRSASGGAPPRGVWFQSHAGSIEAPCRAWRASGSGTSFNPTLVRLRPPSPAFADRDLEEVSIPRWFD